MEIANTMSALINAINITMEVISIDLETCSVVYSGLDNVAKAAFINKCHDGAGVVPISVVTLDDIAAMCPGCKAEDIFNEGWHFGSVAEVIEWEIDMVEPDGLEF